MFFDTTKTTGQEAVYSSTNLFISHSTQIILCKQRGCYHSSFRLKVGYMYIRYIYIVQSYTTLVTRQFNHDKIPTRCRHISHDIHHHHPKYNDKKKKKKHHDQASPPKRTALPSPCINHDMRYHTDTHRLDAFGRNSKKLGQIIAATESSARGKIKSQNSDVLHCIVYQCTQTSAHERSYMRQHLLCARSRSRSCCVRTKHRRIIRQCPRNSVDMMRTCVHHLKLLHFLYILPCVAFSFSRSFNLPKACTVTSNNDKRRQTQYSISHHIILGRRADFAAIFVNRRSYFPTNCRPLHRMKLLP